ncbi:uncharacterized protein C8A04DRAFT_36974 [Dichotomopilus funicola]|uniref:Rhodopsin domain-containing protein n=1 Tax=Dichotomopilus funicola TaxID=1934379 RepID=A0AAN6V332_9PEZI|nr:hypothetical protein C8A04DRAFT_36974 [Dichotomopilus funicola]
MSTLLACALCPPIAAVFVALRLYTARTILRTFHLDDFIPYGLGHHMAYLDAHSWRDISWFSLIALFPVLITSNLAALFSRISILRFYLRFATCWYFTYSIHALTFIVVAAYMLGVFSFLIICQRTSDQLRYFNLSDHGACLNADAWYGWMVAFSCLTDVVLLVLPYWIIRPLRVSCAQRAALAAVLGTGGFVVAVSIVRFVVVAQGWGSSDFTFRFSANYMWSVVELNVGIFCACAPCLRPLISRYVPGFQNFGQRSDSLDLYTIPVSQVHTRLPATPASGQEVEATRMTGTTASTWEERRTGRSGWRAKLFQTISREDKV